MRSVSATMEEGGGLKRQRTTLSFPFVRPPIAGAPALTVDAEAICAAVIVDPDIPSPADVICAAVIVDPDIPTPTPTVDTDALCAAIPTPTPTVDADALCAAIPTSTVDADALCAAIPTPTPTVDADAICAAIPFVDVDATPAAPRYPAWFLLENLAYFDDHQNATTADVKTSTGRNVKVTFLLQDTPAISYFCVHGPELEDADFDLEPKVVFSEKNLVLLSFAFTVGPRSTLHNGHLVEYFVYKAGGGKPSLTPIPTRHHLDNAKSYPSILPYDGDDGNFLLADLALTPTLGHYVLHIFSSKTKKWISRSLQLQTSPAVREDLPSLPDKVIALGAGTIGWIDLWRGIVVCNVFHLEPTLEFIPLPKPEWNLQREGDPQLTRDVTCSNGIIKFIEMEHFVTPVILNRNTKMNFKTMKDLDSADTIYDSELFLNNRTELMEEEPSFISDAWKIRTCYRNTSWNFWRKGHDVHVDDILVDNPIHHTMLPELWDASAGKFTLRNLAIDYPILSIHHSDVVYLLCQVSHQDTWVVGVDLAKKTVEVLEPYSAERSSFTSFLACTFSDHLNPSPCLHEHSCAENSAMNDHTSSGYINGKNLNMHTDNEHASSDEDGDFTHPGYNNVQQPIQQQQQFVPPHSFPLQPNLPSSVSAYVGPVLNTDAYGQLWLSLPMNDSFLSQLRRMQELSTVPFNPLMSPVLLDDRSPQLP